MDTIHKKPQYGARAKLITELLEGWVQEQQRLAKESQPNFAPSETPDA
jgi:hypothetical protein